jgi:hypothetical protein
MVIRLIKMEAKWFQYFLVGDVVVVALEPVHESTFGLAHILFVTSQAGNAVDKVIALTADVGHGRICAPRGGAENAS